MIDATRKEVIVGNTYGYSLSGNGITTITIGTVTKITGAKATLQPISQYRYCGENYNKSNQITEPNPRQIGIRTIQLFPVQL